jgi:hypothetical protein
VAHQQSDFAPFLYRSLPAIYRTRDEGDLRRYFEGCADLLDAVHATLWQRLADNFPDNPPEDSPLEACQDWLLPYFADLVDARLVSPLPDGRRDEIAKAIRWRQGKGTLSVIEAVIESIGQTEAVIQEGWRRVAITPRIAKPLQPAVTLGYAQEPESGNPGSAARHPDLPAVSVDFRCPSRAVEADESNPGAQSITIDGSQRTWRQASLHGLPCFPGSYEDLSRRTVDLRTPDWRVGHYHPSVVVGFLPPPSGFFPPKSLLVNWSDTPSARFRDLIVIDRSEAGRIIFRNKSLDGDVFQSVRVRGRIELDPPAEPGRSPRDFVWRFEGLVLENQVIAKQGRLEFDRCAVRLLASEESDRERPTVTATDCLIRDLDNARGLSRLSCCTLLESCVSEVMEASDCLFLPPIRKDAASDAPPDAGCLRYTRVNPDQQRGGLRSHEVNRDHVALVETEFGRRHCGVLHLSSAPEVLAGAEDGGELGAYHHRYHQLVHQAILLKLKDFLPVGLEAVLVYDPSSTSATPVSTTSKAGC